MNYTVVSGMLIGARNRQEDCILIGSAVSQGDRLMGQTTITADHLLACVCDGLGGHAQGDAASRFVCDEISGWMPRLPAGPPDIRKMLSDIQQSAQQHLPENSGTTIAGIMISRHRCLSFNAGDSRVYRITEDGMARLSHDHSLVQGLVDYSFIHQDKAAAHPLKNIVDFGMGPLFAPTWNHLHIRIHEEAATAGACYLICSDGLSDVMTDPELHQRLMPDPIANGKALFAAALETEPADNASFIIVKIQ